MNRQCLFLFFVLATSRASELQSCSLLQYAKTRTTEHRATEKWFQMPEGTVHDWRTNAPKEKKDCVVVMSTSSKGMDLLRENSEKFDGTCDLITGHYDSNTDVFAQEAWYQKLAVLTLGRPYLNKMEMILDLVQSHRRVLDDYKYVLLTDDDIRFKDFDVRGFVDLAVRTRYNIIAPTLNGRHHQQSQSTTCPVLQTSAMEHLAILIDVSKLKKFTDIILPESFVDGRLTCDWGFPRVACNLLDGNTGTGCAVVNAFGSVDHLDTRSQEEEAAIDLAAAPKSSCTAHGYPLTRYGDNCIDLYRFRYGLGDDDMWLSDKGKCFDIMPDSEASLTTHLTLQADVTFETPHKTTNITVLSEVCSLQKEVASSDFPHYDSPPADFDVNAIYHVHIPKVAGTSFAEDAKRILGSVVSEEACLANYPADVKRVLLLREPRAHVMSQYYFCTESDDRGPSLIRNMLPLSFNEWLDFWVKMDANGEAQRDFTRGDATLHNTPWCESSLPFGCYSPIDLQSHRLTCKDNPYNYLQTNSLESAVTVLNDVPFVGITEAYQESLCLFHVQMHNFLPQWCNSSDSFAWQQSDISEQTHGVAQHNLDELDQSSLDKIDALTAKDRAIYREAIKRFLHEVTVVEETFKTQVLSPEKRATLSSLQRAEGQ